MKLIAVLQEVAKLGTSRKSAHAKEVELKRKQWEREQDKKRASADKDEVYHVGAAVAVKSRVDEQFDMIEQMVNRIANAHSVDPEVVWEDFETVSDAELLESAAWQRKEGKNKEGGLNDAGIASYRRENPGSKLQKAVTTKPSELNPDSKAAKRRKSFCARMGGAPGPLEKDGKPTRKALALRKWNC